MNATETGRHAATTPLPGPLARRLAARELPATLAEAGVVGAFEVALRLPVVVGDAA